MRYAVYINRTRKRASWHREGCGHINKHGGVAARADQDWIWCDTVEEVRQVLRTKTIGFPKGDVSPCGSCRPDTH